MSDLGSLRSELARLRGTDPFRALGLLPTAERGAIRRAYLAAAKLYHPTRYVRQGREFSDLANEIFLCVHKAYEQLVDEDRRTVWREKLTPRSPAPTPAPVPVVAFRPSKAATSAEEVRHPLDGGGEPRWATEGGTPDVPATDPARTTPGAQKPMSPHTGRTADEVQALLESARTRTQRLDDALKLLQRGKYRDAREALFKIAAEDPQNRRIRVSMHLSWGLEHRAEDRFDDAERELSHALALDPECVEARDALRKVQSERKGGGLLGKLFGR